MTISTYSFSSIKEAVDALKASTAANSISPSILAAILYSLNSALKEVSDAASNPSAAIPTASANASGLMSAKMFAELNHIKSTAEALIAKDNELAAAISKIDAATDRKAFNTAQISTCICKNELFVKGAEPLLAKGYVPYIFRKVSRNNPIKVKGSTAHPKRRKRREWAAFGSCHSVVVEKSGRVLFSSLKHSSLSLPHSKADRTASPTAYVSVKPNNKGVLCVGWGARNIKLQYNPTTYRYVQLRFAIAFGPKILPGRASITPDKMFSKLAEFSVCFDPFSRSWHFST